MRKPIRQFSNEEIQIITDMVNAGKAASNIVVALKSDIRTIRKIVKQLNLQFHNKSEIDKIKQLANENTTIREISKLTGIDYGRIRYIINRDNLPHRNNSKGIRNTLKVRNTPTIKEVRIIPINEIIEDYNIKLYTLTQTAEKHKLSQHYIKKILKENGIEIRPKQKKIIKKVSKTTGIVVKKKKYWNPIQEDMIIPYLNASLEERSSIFEKYYYYPIQTMAEIILKKYFYGNLSNIDRMNRESILDAVAHVAIKLHKYKVSKVRNNNGVFSFVSYILKHHYYDYFNIPIKGNKKIAVNNFVNNSIPIINEENNSINDRIDYEVYQRLNVEEEDNHDIEEVRQKILITLESIRKIMFKKELTDLVELLDGLIYIYSNLDFPINYCTNAIFMMYHFNVPKYKLWYKRLKRVYVNTSYKYNIRYFFPKTQYIPVLNKVFFEIDSKYDMSDLSIDNWNKINKDVNIIWNEDRIVQKKSKQERDNESWYRHKAKKEKDAKPAGLVIQRDEDQNTEENQEEE